MSESPVKMGRPTMQVKEIVPYLCDAFEMGCTMKDAIAGIMSKPTYLDYYHRGEEDVSNGIDSDFSYFFNEINKANRKYRDSLRSMIKKAAPDDWRAANWLLERSDPDTYNLKQKVEATQTVEVSQKAMIELPQNERRSIEAESL